MPFFAELAAHPTRLFLASLPVLSFAGTLLILASRYQRDPAFPYPWESAFLRASLAWGALLAISTELASAVQRLNPATIALIWGAALLALGIYGWRLAGNRHAWEALRHALRAWNRLGGLRMLPLALMACTLLVIALQSPTNTSDSLQYHLARVAHWIQAGSLRHYATAYHPQLVNPIWAETAILHFRLLWQGDRLANLVQWFSMLGSLVAINGVAGQLGASRRGRAIALAFAVSVPMGILQASSTQNDYVVGYWLLCLAFHVLQLRQEPSVRTAIWAGLALGLGMLTKATFYIYALPLVLWSLLLVLRQIPRSKLLGCALALLLIPLALNAGYWLRNWQTYRGLFGPREWVEATTQTRVSLPRLASGLARQIAQNLGTPEESLNQQLGAAVVSIERSMGLDLGEFQPVWRWNHEDFAGNPLHLAWVPLSLIAVAATGAFRADRRGWLYALAVLSTYALLAVGLEFAAFNVRYQLPFFLLWAPLAGVAAAQLSSRRLYIGLLALLYLYGLPWLLFNSTRPLIGLRPYTSVRSIFAASQAELLFANRDHRHEPFVQVTDLVKSSGCTQVGMFLDSGDFEYAFWWLLRAPESGVQLQVISTYPALERYLDPDFEPCAVLCTVCGGRQELAGLPLKFSTRGVALYAGDE